MPVVNLTLRNEPSATAALRRAVEQVAAENGLSPEAAFDLKLAATEAVGNALRYASGQGSAVDVALMSEDGVVEVEVRDRGRTARAPHRDPDGGRGIPLMLALTDEVDFASTGDGTRVRLTKRVERHGLDEASPL